MESKPDTNSHQANSEEKLIPPISVVAQYIKDLSYEAPSTPSILASINDSKPDIDINVDVKANHIEDAKYEVVLFINAHCKLKSTNLFVVELTYAGLFNLITKQENLGPLLLIECPRLLFPFARNIIADTTREGGFPPLFLSPLDFVSMYKEGVLNTNSQDINDEN